MPVVCDMQVIQGDSNKRLGDGGATIWEKDFGTGGRYSGGDAILMFMVKGLTATESTVDVKINNRSVGRIYPYTGADSDHWFTQIINIGGGILKSGTNELQIQAVTWPGSTSGDIWDDFWIRDVVCFFQQKA
jgi:hypothetical protein